MLQVLYTPCPKAKEQFFLKNMSQDDLWLVAHIEAKRTLQDFFLQSQTTIFSKSVLRASEYWQWLFAVNCPEWRAVSESLVYTLIEEWFEKNETDVRYRNIEMFHTFFAQVLPLVAVPDAEVIEEWLASDPQRKHRLGGWLEQARLFWNFLQERRLMGRAWSVSVLNLQENLIFGDYKNVYVDLGLDLRQEEMEMLLRLSKEKNVVVFIPKTEWTATYSQNLDVYKKIIEAADKTATLERAHEPVAVRVHQHPSVLKETKTVVGAVRELLESGVPAKRIGIFSTNIEDYWDMLREHFLVEGVPVQKKYVLRTISLPSVQTWISRLHLYMRDFEQSHLEGYLFNEYDTPMAWNKYDNFRKDFSNIYDTGEIKEHFALPQEVKSNQEMSFLEFVSFAQAKWPLKDNKIAEDVADEMAKDVRLDDVFTYDLWLNYFEMVVSRMETEVRAADDSGVVFANFNQTDWLDLDHAFVMGCAQNRLRENTPSPLTAEDIARAEFDLGFYLQRNENLKKEFELKWFCEKALRTLSLSHSHSDFEGQPQTAASAWLELEKPDSTMPEPRTRPRWDSLMTSDMGLLGTELCWKNNEAAAHEEKFTFENSVETFRTLMPRNSISLSVSGLERLFSCPFKFYATKVLSLQEPREYDLDVDPMFQGQLLHSLAEEISKRHPDFVISKAELSALYDQVVKKEELTPLGRFWLQEKPRQLILIQNFVEVEALWRKKFPKTQTVATEAKFSGFIGIQDGIVKLSKEKLGDGFYPITGRIDRVDRGPKGEMMVVDYKTTMNNLSAFKNWAKDGQFQMPIYAAALEAGLCENIPAAPVVGASYVCFKEKERCRGFVLDGEDHGFGDLAEGRRSTLASRETKDEVFAAVFEQIKTVIMKLNEGRFAPVPITVEECKTCEWRKLCRAPHLK